jgi:hypothetical protein
MGDALDQFSKSLASGASRRRALGALLAGSVSVLPLTAEGRKNKNKRKRKLQRKFAPYQQACEDWTCLEDARVGKGPCFAADGSGAACLEKCPEGQFCCPALLSTGKVGFVECCTTECGLSLNSTLICNT